MHKRFLAGIYARNFFIIFCAFVLAYLLIDLLINYKRLAFNSNIFLLYVLFCAISAAYFLLPAALMIAFFAAKAQLLARNELIALRSLGLSPRAFAAPMIAVALAICACFIAILCTQAAYAAEYKSNILSTGAAKLPQKNLLIAPAAAAPFSELIFVASAGEHELKRLIWLRKNAGELERVIMAQSATLQGFSGDASEWQLADALVMDFAKTAPVGAASAAGISNTRQNQASEQNMASGEKFTNHKNLLLNNQNFLFDEEFLRNFSATAGRPEGRYEQKNFHGENEFFALKKFISSEEFAQLNAAQSASAQHFEHYLLRLNIQKEIFEHQKSEALSLADALRLASSLRETGIIRASIYAHTVFFLFAPFLGAALLVMLPTQTRFSELGICLAGAIFVSLSIFGSLNLLKRFSQNGAIAPELGILAPSLAVIMLSVYFLFSKHYR